MKRKVLSVMLASAMLATMFAGCGNGNTGDASGTANAGNKTEEVAKTTEASDAEKTADSASGSGSVYYLNFKPEQDQAWQDLAGIYTEQTGVPVTVITAADGTYEQTLKSEMAKSEAPTLFQVNGPVGLANWKDYCYDLSDSEICKQLSSEDFALKNDAGEVSGVAYVLETYGIIYNKKILNDYCTMDNAVISSPDEINSFDKLKAVADDIQARKDEINSQFGYDLQGAFTSAGMDGSSDWRFKTHLANLPIYYEYKADDIDTTDAIKGTYLDNYRNIWNLYINNATCDPSLLSTKTGDDAVAEFVTEQAVFYQNGTWAYNDVAELGDDNLGMLPIYIGAEGEDKQGLCTGTENYWCVNSKASEADIQATLDFMYWCVTSEVGTKAMCGGEGAMPSGDAGMGFVIPFKGNLESSNPLVNIANQYVADGYTPVAWTFSTMPSEEWKNGVGSALTTYAADQTDDNWAAVVSAFVDGWAKEAAASK